jgi:hypothetical protein
VKQPLLFNIEIEPSLDGPTKRCSWCEKTLPLDRFRLAPGYSQGVRHSCLRCDKAHQEVIDACRASGQYAALLEEQAARCGICGEEETMHGKQSSLCIDVDHRTMHVRGLLCRTCNIMLGRMEKVDRVLLYLRRAQERNGWGRNLS